MANLLAFAFRSVRLVFVITRSFHLSGRSDSTPGLRSSLKIDRRPARREIPPRETLSSPFRVEHASGACAQARGRRRVMRFAAMLEDAPVLLGVLTALVAAVLA
jgi:hypothetical protein